MTTQKYAKLSQHLNELENRFETKFAKKIAANQNHTNQLAKALKGKREQGIERIHNSLERVQKRYETKTRQIQREHEIQVNKLKLRQLTQIDLDNDLNRLDRLRDQALAILKVQFDRENQRLTQKQKLIDEECTWVLDDFKKTTTTKLEELKNAEITKLKLARAKLLFLKKRNEKKVELKNKLRQSISSSEKLIYQQQLHTLTSQLYHDGLDGYIPLKIRLLNAKNKLHGSSKRILTDSIEKTKLLKHYSFRDFLRIPIFGCPLYLYAILFAIAILAICTKTVGSNIMTGLGLLLVFSMLVGTIFNKLPVWKTYFGGGAVACFLLAGFLGRTFNVIPPDVQNSIKAFFSGETGGDFLNLYIIILLCGAILTMPKKLIAASIGKYGLLVVLTIVLAGAIGFGFGRAFGLAPNVILLRVLAPLLGGGNGSGAVPMAQMASATGYAVEGHDKFYGNILIIVVLGNVFMIIVSGLLSPVGKSVKLSGNGKILNQSIFMPKRDENCQDRHVTLALVLFVMIFILSHTVEVVIKKNTISKHFTSGLIISQFAWAIVFALLLNLSGIIPQTIISGSKKLSAFFTKEFTLVIMSGIGLGIDFKNLVSSFDPRLLWVAIITCCLLLIIPFLLANLFGMFAFESMLAAGACEGAMGGSGAVACLSASKRMELMPYAQITCRIGGSAMLIVVSPLFSVFAPH